MRHVLLDSVMSKAFAVVSPQAPLTEVVAAVRNRGSCFVVVCEEGKPLGVISKRDVVDALASNQSGEAGQAETAFDLMSFPAFTLLASNSVADAMKLLFQRNVRRAPVVSEEGRLVGVVTQADLLLAHSREVQGHTRELSRIVDERTRELREANEQLRVLAYEDALLGIGNRRAMERAVGETHALARRYARPYGLILFDVDHFKAYNDHYGHPSGDRALVEIATTLHRKIRSVDRLFRYGGEELVALLPETSVSSAECAAQRLCSTVATLAIPHGVSPRGILTVSAGVSGTDSGMPVPAEWQAVLRQADEALYEAKNAGRDRVVRAAAEVASGAVPT